MTEEPICKLCLKKKASSIKSHIFSHFFIKSMLNPTGISTRGVGRSFQISGHGGTKTFFERNVSMKDYQRLFGDEKLSEIQLKELMMDPYSESYLLCINCEARLGIVEDYFNDNVFKQVFDPNNIHGICSLQKADNLLIRLFFLSMLWRSSAAEYDKFQFSEDIEEKLRLILDDSIGKNLEETEDLAFLNSEAILNEAIFCCTSRVFCEISANQILIQTYTKPYFFEINEYTVCYFSDNTDLSISENLFGLEKYLNNNTININEDQFQICIIDNSEWDLKRHQIGKKMASEFIDFVKKKFLNEYYQRKGTKLRQRNLELFMNELIYSPETTLALRYSDDRIESLINKYTK